MQGFYVAATFPGGSRHRTAQPRPTRPCKSCSIDIPLPPDQQAWLGDTIAVDIQAILLWVKENNPKQFIEEGRLDKTLWMPRQPAAADAL